MSRDVGFRTADIDVGILDDPKVRALVRSTRDEAIVARCLVAYVAVLMASWEHAERISLEDAAPAWLTGLDDLRGRLAKVQLVDEEGRVVERAFDAWVGPALERQASFRERWRRANDRRRKPDSDSTDAVPRGDSDSTDAVPGPTGRQAGPSGPSGLRTREERKNGSQGGSARPAPHPREDDNALLEAEAMLVAAAGQVEIPDTIRDRTLAIVSRGTPTVIAKHVGQALREGPEAADQALVAAEARVALA